MHRWYIRFPLTFDGTQSHGVAAGTIWIDHRVLAASASVAVVYYAVEEPLQTCSTSSYYGMHAHGLFINVSMNSFRIFFFNLECDMNALNFSFRIWAQWSMKFSLMQTFSAQKDRTDCWSWSPETLRWDIFEWLMPSLRHIIVSTWLFLDSQLPYWTTVHAGTLASVSADVVGRAESPATERRAEYCIQTPHC